MYTIKTLNAISPVGLAKLNNKQFDVAVDTDAPDGILVRSADMLNTAFNDNLLAIARAGAGVNNIPLDRCSEQGIVVFNTPGANANAVAELVIGMLIAGSRNVAVAAQWCQGLAGDPAMAKTVEKGKKQFVGNEIKGKFLRDKGYNQQELDASGLFKRSASGRIYCLFWKRVMTPIFDLRGNIIAFGGRVLDDSKPKYVNSPETLVYHKSETVFALQIAKRSAVRRFVLCEGYMDVISMHQAGIDTAVCACGTALTPEQVRLISEYADEVILSYDSDEAGQKATLRSLELFRNSPVKVGVLQIPGAKDPDEYIKKYGAERFKALLDGVGNALDFRLGRLRSQYDLAQDAQRLEYVKEAVNMLAERSNPTEQEVYAGRLAEETNISKTAIMTQLETAVKRAGSKHRWEKKQQALKSGEMNQINVPYSAGGSQALGIASAQQRLLAAILREPNYIDLVQGQLTAEQFVLPQQKELFEAMLRCRQEGIEISLTTLRAFVSEEALNELSHLAAQYSDVNCTPDDIRLYLDRIARGMPMAGKAAHMSNEELSDYLQSMREKKQGNVPVEE